MLLAVRDEETGEGIGNKQLRDEVLTLILAGHETTATTLSRSFVPAFAEPSGQAQIARGT